jgi:F-type H+-transporting ATPase subunit gamma
MPGLKEVRIRIASVKSTQQITNAMKMVAASKFRKAQSAILKLRPYAAKLGEILQNLSASIGESPDNPFSQKREPEKILLVVIVSNRGLCGGFNSNIIKTTLHLLATTFAEQHSKGNVSLVCIGRKASEYFVKRKFNMAGVHDGLLENITFDKIRPFTEGLMKSFLDKQYDQIDIVYNHFKNAAVQQIVVEQFLPILPLPPSKDKTKVVPDYIIEPDKETILSELIPKTLRIQFFKAILDSFAGEQGARMTAMQKATENAQELLKALRLSYNKARQAAITKEILEIVSGAEALKG